MDQIVEAVYNDSEKQFEVYIIDHISNTRSLALVQTHEDILEQLRAVVVETMVHILGGKIE